MKDLLMLSLYFFYQKILDYAVIHIKYHTKRNKFNFVSKYRGFFFIPNVLSDEEVDFRYYPSLFVLYLCFISGNVTINGALLPLPDFTATNGVLHLTTKVFVPLDFC